jgi:S-adenosylmethionine synthetase
VACETLTTTNRWFWPGKSAARGSWTPAANWALTGIEAEIEAAVRAAVRDIGYEQKGFHWDRFEFINRLHGQSAHIAQGVDASGNKDEGAGDQGIMFGYASNETPELMPATLQYSHNILKRLAEVRHGGDKRLEPDAKSQVTIQYEDGVPVRATSIVLSTQHAAGLSSADVAGHRQTLHPRSAARGLHRREHRGTSTRPASSRSAARTATRASPAARSSSTPTAARPRTAAAPSRARIRPRSTARPPMPAATWPRTSSPPASPTAAPSRSPTPSAWPSRSVDPRRPARHRQGRSGGAGSQHPPDLIGGATPRAIREHLGLNKPIYARTAAYGHFGRAPDNDGGFSWEKTDLVDRS